MLKRLAAALMILAVMCGVAQATTVDSDYRYNLDNVLLDDNDTYANYLYRLYGDHTGFNYQLRELAGRNTAGSQWFATVYENYYYNLYEVDSDYGNRSVYRRTMGGEIPEVTFSAVGNIIGGFNFMLAEEPQPYDYQQWANIYDPYPDPIESLCLVITNGSGNFNINFGNPYASHFPYWWHWTTLPGSNLWDSRSRVRSINEPIAFMINTSTNEISERGADGNYTDKYTYVLSTDYDASGDVLGTHYEINDLTGALVWKTSGDTVLDSADETVYSFTDENVYNADGSLAYTMEYSGNILYLCEARSVYESVRVDGFDDYSFTFNPNNERAVLPAEYYSTNVRILSNYGGDYGSKLGYITFNQRADLMRGYTRYRENTTIPLVVANVYDGNAAYEPLQFDMTVYDSETDKTASHVINRVKFTWDAQQDMPNQDFGTFFMIKSSADKMPVYYLETKITNRTGTRYRLYRYDMLGRTTGFQEILPTHWKYDLPLSPSELKRETLPQYFHLDAHSQIAPGLVTVYDHSVYGTMDTAYDTYESFQLSEYDSPNPKNLRLNYRRVGGLDLIAGTEENLDGVRTREFVMNFADVIHNDEETAYELENLMGKPPVMTASGVRGSVTASAPSRNSKAVSHDSVVYINSSAIDAFRFRKAVPEGLVTLDVISTDIPESEDVSQDVQPTPAPAPEQGNNNTETPTVEVNVNVSAVEVTYVSHDIPLQPLSIRMRIPRQNQLVINRWQDFENAASSQALFNAFARCGTVWLRSDSTGELDANLFTAIDNKGGNLGVGAADCVRAFIYEDELYLDFIVILADGASTRTGKTAYVEVFRDDGVPYVLIGDGKENGEWDMTFYIAATGDNPTQRDTTPTTPVSSDVSADVHNIVSPSEDSGGGGGCNSGLTGLSAMMILLAMVKFSRR